MRILCFWFSVPQTFECYVVCLGYMLVPDLCPIGIIFESWPLFVYLFVVSYQIHHYPGRHILNEFTGLDRQLKWTKLGPRRKSFLKGEIIEGPFIGFTGRNPWHSENVGRRTNTFKPLWYKQNLESVSTKRLVRNQGNLYVKNHESFCIMQRRHK